MIVKNFQHADTQHNNFTVIGPTLKETIQKSSFSQEEVAAAAEMSLNNLYKIFRKDSLETRYLVRICRKLRIPYSQLLGKEDWLDQPEGNTGNIMIASKTGGSNSQHYSVGASSGNEEVLKLQYELQLCQVERSSLVQRQRDLEQRLKDKEDLIEILKNK